jgi:hypothetical protein
MSRSRHLVLPLALLLASACVGDIERTAGGEAGADASPGGGGVGDGDGGGDGEECLIATLTCENDDQCCGDLSCGTTTLGQVCCGEVAATCNTASGEDCCGDLLCIDGTCQGSGAIHFKAPFQCDERWTYSHHSQEVRLALDFIRDDGGATDGAPVLASAGGVATQHVEAGGAGNYIVIDHGGGWTSYYFHLSAFSVADGTTVTQGQEVGLTGTTGASSGPHIHYEQLLNGVGQEIFINSDSLMPYPGTYGNGSIVSDNACP